MKRTTFFFWLAAMSAVLTLSSCHIVINGDDDTWFDSDSFNYSLRRTWKPQPGTPSYMAATVEIDHNTIRITGAQWGPLSSFTQGSRLKGYSTAEKEDSWDVKRGTIHIRDKGSWQETEYIYWLDADQKKHLTFKSGSTEITLIPQ